MSRHRSNNNFDNLCGSSKTFQKNETSPPDIVAGAVTAAAIMMAVCSLKNPLHCILLIHYMTTTYGVHILKPKDSDLIYANKVGGALVKSKTV